MPSELQPPRCPGDGDVRLHRGDGDSFFFTVTQDGAEQTLWLSGFNAWRLFGMLAIMLGVPLPKKIGKAIKL